MDRSPRHLFWIMVTSISVTILIGLIRKASTIIRVFIVIIRYLNWSSICKTNLSLSLPSWSWRKEVFFVDLWLWRTCACRQRFGTIWALLLWRSWLTSAICLKVRASITQLLRIKTKIQLRIKDFIIWIVIRNELIKFQIKLLSFSIFSWRGLLRRRLNWFDR